MGLFVTAILILEMILCLACLLIDCWRKRHGKKMRCVVVYCFIAILFNYSIILLSQFIK